MGQPLMTVLARPTDSKLSYVECAVTPQSARNTFRIRTYRKHGGRGVELVRRDKFELAGRGVRDFAEDGGALGAGGGGDVAGAVVEGFVGHQGEG